MAKFEDHCLVDEKHLGGPFPEVHKWLDHFARSLGNRHRSKRHHREGIEEVRGRWGEEAARAAELHVMTDMGHIPTAQDWEAGGVLNQDGQFDLMDDLGRRASYMDNHPAADAREPSIAWCAKLECGGCTDEVEQKLIDLRSGVFLCPVCGANNSHPDYKIEF